MADRKTQDRSDEMEHDLGKLEDHIADAEKKLEGRKREADVVDDVAGDGEDDTDGDGRVDEEVANPT